MSPTAMIILLVVALTVALLCVRFVITKVINKGTDAIRNKIADRKNAQASHEPTNLADRYKK